LETPDGEYVLQLTAYGSPGQERVHEFPLLVDNTAPSVSWVFPTDGAVLDAGPVDLQANAQDNLGLTQVDFFVDGQLIGSVEPDLVSVDWQAEPGEHQLRVQATDQAGSSAISVIKIVVQ